MSGPTFADRFFLWFARNVERPVLAFVPSQAVVQELFHLTAQVGQRVPEGMRLREDADGGMWFQPRGVPEDAGLLLYLHGGGFTIGSPRTHRALIAHLAEAAGLRAYAPRYPLAPSHPFPAAPDSVWETYQRLCTQGDTPVALAGDSAGGNLALGLAIRARDAGLPVPRALALIAPLADATADIKERCASAPSEHLLPAAWAGRISKLYFGDADRHDPRASPALAKLEGLPPTLLHIAEGEALTPDAEYLAAYLPDATLKSFPGLHHVWHLRAGSRAAATDACADLGAFLAERCSP